MAYTNNYPNVDPNRYNDNWLLYKMQELEAYIKNLDFQALIDQSFQQLINSGYFDALMGKYSALVSTTPVNLYVSAQNGNDNNPGTKELPIKSSAKVMDLLPKLINGNFSIFFDNTGTYDNLELSGISGAGSYIYACDVNFTPLTSGYVDIAGLSIGNSTVVIINGFHIITQEAYSSFIQTSTASFTRCSFENSANGCLGVTGNASVTLENCSLKSQLGVSLNYGARGFAYNCTFDTRIGLYPKYGSQASYVSCTFINNDAPIVNYDGSLQLSSVGNIPLYVTAGVLSESFALAPKNVSSINHIRMDVFDSTGCVSSGYHVFNEVTAVYDEVCMGKDGLNFTLASFQGPSGLVQVSAELNAANMITITCQNLSGTYNYILSAQ